MPWLAWVGAAHAGLLGAAHHGVPEADGIVWETQLSMHGERQVDLAVDLPMEDVVDIRFATPVVRDGRVLALVREQASYPYIELTTRQHDREVLRPPLVVDAQQVQQVTLERLRYDPEPSMGIEKRVGWMASTGISSRDRRGMLRELTRDHSRRKAGSLVVRIDRPLGAGLAGTIEDGTRPRFGAVLGALAAGLGLVLAMFGMHRWLEHVARRERFDSWLSDSTSDGST